MKPVTNADRIIGKREIDLESDPPPDLVVEVDITNESFTKSPIYAACAFPRFGGSTGRLRNSTN